MRSFIGQGRREAIGTSVGLALLISLGVLLYPNLHLETRAVLVAAAASIPALTALGLNGAMASAVRSFVVGLLPELLLRPLIFLFTIAAFAMLGVGVGVAAAVLTMTAITIALAAVQFLLVRRRLPRGAPAVVVIVFTALFADLGILVGTLHLPAADLAAFAICLKVALIVGFVVQISHQTTLPDLAEAYAQRATNGLRPTFLKATAIPVAVCLAATVASLLWGDRFLGLFGPEFSRAQGVLTVLVGCQLLRALAGPSTLLLTLEGAQRTNAAICAASAGVLFAASIPLAPSIGVVGAAAAVLLTFCFWLGATAVVLRRRGAPRPDVFGQFAGLRARKA